MSFSIFSRTKCTGRFLCSVWVGVRVRITPFPLLVLCPIPGPQPRRPLDARPVRHLCRLPRPPHVLPGAPHSNYHYPPSFTPRKIVTGGIGSCREFPTKVVMRQFPKSGLRIPFKVGNLPLWSEFRMSPLGLPLGKGGACVSWDPLLLGVDFLSLTWSEPTHSSYRCE